MSYSKETPLVIKIGGSTLGSHDTTLEDIVTLQRRGESQVVVHGGGELVSRWMARQGLEAKFVKGLRVTDDAALEVACAVLAGLVNKQLVSAINAMGGRAVGLSGVDGNLTAARVKDPDLGLVGEIVSVDLTVVDTLMEAGYVPVIASLGVLSSPSGSASQILNINADTVAGEIAAAMPRARLIFLTDVEGVLDASGQVLPTLAEKQAKEMLASGTASGGMIPKIEACLRAAACGHEAGIVDGRVAHMLLAVVDRGTVGTVISKV